MAIILPEQNLLIVEFPRTATTWLRRTLRALDVPHSIPVAEPGKCPRHSPVTSYGWSGDTVVFYRRPKDWVESMWRHHRGRWYRKMYNNIEYGFEFMMPFDPLFETWVQRFTIDDVEAYYRRMMDGVGTIVPFEDAQRWLADTIGKHVPREPVNASVKIACQWR